MTLLDLLQADDNALLADVCRALDLSSDRARLRPVLENSNLNEVVELTLPGRRLFIKHAPKFPLTPEITVPAERNRYEAEALDLAARIDCGIVTPTCLYIDTRHHFFVMDDIARSETVLTHFDQTDFRVLLAHVDSLATWLCRLHESPDSFSRPAEQTEVLRRILYGQILAQGVKAALPDDWESVVAACTAHQDALVHCDMWGKNFMVTEDGRLGIVDFEGVMRGDAAGDIAAVLCTALFCCLGNAHELDGWRDFCLALRDHYVTAATSHSRATAVLDRVAPHLVLLLTHRSHGSFPYDLSDTARSLLVRTSAELQHAGAVSYETAVDCIRENGRAAAGLTGPDGRHADVDLDTA